MQPQGSTSTLPSFDSLSSSDSLLLSDSEQAEDDSDVFLTDPSSSVIINREGEMAANKDATFESPRSQWADEGFADKEEEEDESYRAVSRGSDVGEHTSKTAKSQGDLLFAQKCAELQGFVRPLHELLNGLKKGRFDHGLSSFQQSVAMDRIQRIVGVLQRPDCGERYLNTLLQVEGMLKLWFPQISTHPVSSSSSSAATSPAHSVQDTSSSTPPHKHRDQLHIPVKKRRLSWTGTDSPSPSPVPTKCPRTSAEEIQSKKVRDRSPSSLFDTNQFSPDVNGSPKGNESEGEEQHELSKYKAARGSEPRLTWVHIAPILSPRTPCPLHEGAGQKLLMASRRGSPAMQDSSISSTTTSSKNARHQKKPVQSQPATASTGAGEQNGSETAGMCLAREQLLRVSLKPLARVSPAALET